MAFRADQTLMRKIFASRPISALRRLGTQNLAEEDPSRIVQWLFYSHPPIRDRIAAAQAFRL